MKYIYDGNFIEGIFLNRPNRFIAEVDVNGKVVICHVKNTGRMTEILTPGKKCYIMEAKNLNRKTKYDLISIEHAGIIVNLDSQIPNKVIADGFLNSEIRGWENPDGILREVAVGKSRLDMKVVKGERQLFVEVKGVDLIKNKNHAMFPDAVTVRGTRHLRELEEIVKLGFDAMVIFLIAREDAIDFRPHYEMDPVFSDTFYEVLKTGVEARAYLTNVGYNFIELGKEIPILPDIR
ncbi:MAG: DNA/RNA nuclease SfsA [Tissierellia bacterium]|nr:DNA/RNA nuclease SfsA [Tissierellia bacterium]